MLDLTHRLFSTQRQQRAALPAPARGTGTSGWGGGLLPGVRAGCELPARALPPHNPQYQLMRGGPEQAPTITSPLANTEYVLDPHEHQQLLLSCTTNNEVRRVHWYVNDRFLQTAGATEQVFFHPSPGLLKISCADDHGRNVDAQVLVMGAVEHLPKLARQAFAQKKQTVTVCITD